MWLVISLVILCTVVYDIVLRDINERGRTLESVIDQYTTFVKSSFEDFTLPVRNYKFKITVYNVLATSFMLYISY